GWRANRSRRTSTTTGPKRACGRTSSTSVPGRASGRPTGRQWHVLTVRAPRISLVRVFGLARAPVCARERMVFLASRGLARADPLPTTLIIDDGVAVRGETRQ